jgi:hypothetical protein
LAASGVAVLAASCGIAFFGVAFTVTHLNNRNACETRHVGDPVKVQAFVVFHHVHAAPCRRCKLCVRNRDAAVSADRIRGETEEVGRLQAAHVDTVDHCRTGAPTSATDRRAIDATYHGRPSGATAADGKDGPVDRRGRTRNPDTSPATAVSGLSRNAVDFRRRNMHRCIAAMPAIAGPQNRRAGNMDSRANRLRCAFFQDRQNDVTALRSFLAVGPTLVQNFGRSVSAVACNEHAA